MHDNEKYREELIGYQFVFEETNKINDELVNEVQKLK